MICGFGVVVYRLVAKRSRKRDYDNFAVEKFLERKFDLVRESRL